MELPMTQAGCYVLFISFLFFNRSRQSSGSASKLAFFDAFPLEIKKKKKVTRVKDYQGKKEETIF